MLRKNNLRTQNMPQDSLRSIVYRSFVTCDDPKGVVDCNTIRKSRTDSQKMEHKMENRRTPRNSNVSLPAYKAEKEEVVSKRFTEEVHSQSSYQLMEVSRGAQKLNHVIDSWSKDLIFEGQPKDIAKDLLKGALDLQESLNMLGKLQEASQYMAKLKKKEIEKSEKKRVDEVRIERTYSSQFGDQNYSMGFQKPRLSADGSSRNCNDELKRVVRDSLARQNLLPNPTIEEMTYLHRRDSDSASEIPSTSSNQSSMVQAFDFGSTYSSLSSTAPQKKAKGSNLIAKLMGLEELASKPLQTTLQKHLEIERIRNQRRPIFDIDMPKRRKPQCMVHNVDPERRTLKEILETVQFQGLLKRNSVIELKPQSYYSDDSHSYQRLPPIVLIKPLRVPCLVEERRTPVLQEEKAFDTKKLPRKLKIKEELPSKTIDRREGHLGSNKMHRKLEAEETPIKRLSSEERTRKRKEVVKKPEEKEVKSKEKASNKVKASSPEDHKPQKKEAIDKKNGKIQKVTSASRKPLEMQIVKARNVSRSQDQTKMTSTKPRKPENGSNIINNQIPQQTSTTQNSISKRTTKTIVSNSTDQRKNQIKKTKPVKEPTAAKLVIENIGCTEDDKRIDLTSENCPLLIRIDTILADQLPIEEETGASESHIGEHCSNTQSSLNDITPPSPKQEMNIETADEAYTHISHTRVDSKSVKTGTNLKALLMSSPSFLSHSEELFDLNVSSSIILQTSGNNDFVEANVKLSLECATELIERKSLQDSNTVHPLLLTCVSNSRIFISIDKLVEEVCNGVENLTSYSKLIGESLLVDSLYAMLERDISFSGVENGIWDLGWRHGFSVDDAEQVVSHIEKLVLNGLIEEVFK